MRAWRWVMLLALGAVLGVAPPVRAQDVERSHTSFGSTRRNGDRAAEEQKRTDWPRITEGNPGTQVHVTFDPRNLDLVFITGLGFGQEPLLRECQAIAKTIDRPLADFIWFTGAKGVSVDVELNDYLRHPAEKRTEVTLDLGALVKALEASALPKPIVLCIQPEDADEARLPTTGTAPRLLKGATFLSLSEAAGARLDLAATIPWYAPLVLAVMGALLLSAVGLMIAAAWKIAARMARPEPESAEVPSPEEVQKEYDKQPSIIRMMGLTAAFPTVLLALSVFGNPAKVLQSVEYALPAGVSDQWVVTLPLLTFGCAGLSFAAGRIVTRRRALREGQSLETPPPDPDAPPAWTRHWWWVMMLGIMLILMLVVVYATSGLPKGPWLAAIPIGLLVVMAIGSIIGSWLQLRASRRPLLPGDPVYEMVQEVATHAGVRVRHVAQVLSPTPNAYATLLGTVGLSAGLLRQLEPEEVRAVVAHEIGHLRCGHVRRSFTHGLLFAVGAFAVWWFATGWFEGRVSYSTYFLLRSPMVTIVLMPLLRAFILGRGQRKREEEADRFAVEVTGDPELVIRALTRVHTLAATPHRLKPSDEAISTHPDLLHRIEAIRRDARLGRI